MSVIDLDSESMRFLGDFRFDLKGLQKAFDLDKYHGTLSFLPYEEGGVSDEVIPHESDEKYTNGPKILHEKDNDGWETVEGPFSFFIAVNTTKISINTGVIGKHKKQGDGAIDIVYAKFIESRAEFFKFLLGLNDATFLEFPYVVYKKVRAFRLEPQQDQIKQAKIALDGERTDRWRPIYVEAHKSPIKMYCSS